MLTNTGSGKDGEMGQRKFVAVKVILLVVVVVVVEEVEIEGENTIVEDLWVSGVKATIHWSISIL